MHVELPDPHPGRCLNHRAVLVDGYSDTLRCLEAEGTEHVCRFPPARNRTLSSVVQTIYTDTEHAEPWVVPS